MIDSQKLILKNLGHTVTIPQDLPQLDYLREPQGSVTDLLESLDRQIGEPVDLWIIHNPTLGKNALFPDLIETLARRGDRKRTFIPLLSTCTTPLSIVGTGTI